MPQLISREGFDPRVCSLSGMFGGGVYFADKVGIGLGLGLGLLTLTLTLTLTLNLALTLERAPSRCATPARARLATRIVL